MPRKKPGPRPEGRVLSGHHIENNGEDSEYLRSLGKLSDERMASLASDLRDLMEKSKGLQGGLLAKAKAKPKSK